MPAQQQVERARAPVARLRRRDREDFSPQPDFFQPSRNGTPEHPRAAWTETSAGDHEYAAPPGFRRAVDEGGERVMRFGLGLAVQIETGLDRVVAALETFGIGPVDPREMVKRRGPNLRPGTLFLGLLGLALFRGARNRHRCR